MFEIPPPATSPEFGTPDVGAARAMKQALATVALLQKAVSEQVAVMIPGAWPTLTDRTQPKDGLDGVDRR